jgi:GAF domain-containing protein
MVVTTKEIDGGTATDSAGREGVTGAVEHLLELIQRGDSSMSVPERVCLACPTAMNVDGAGISLLSYGRINAVAASDELAEEIEGLQALFGEGPCYDALATRGPVLAPDLSIASARERWSSFAPDALDAGARAVFGFPVIFRGDPLGALDLYSRTPGELTDEDLGQALLLADIAAIAVHDLSVRAHPSSPTTNWSNRNGWSQPAVVHQACGMTSVHLGISVDEALARLEAHAFSMGRSIIEVAGDIVHTRMRLERWDDT